MKIIQIDAIQILDSRGNPTLQVSTTLNDGSKGTFQVPSGASTGIHEALELRDQNKNIYNGKSVIKCLQKIDNIKHKLYDKDFTQETLDKELIDIDGTDNKSNLGANSILGISISFAKACAMHFELPLYKYLYFITNKLDIDKKTKINIQPIPLFCNLINGGLHAGNDLQIQEFMIVQHKGPMSQRVRSTSEIYHELKSIIENKLNKSQTSIGDEGGFAPLIEKPDIALSLLTESIKNKNYEDSISLALDCAASDFYIKETNKYKIEPNTFLDYKSLTSYYNDLLSKYPIDSIEDPFSEDDTKGFEYFSSNNSYKSNNKISNTNKLMIVGDDLTVTNPKRVEDAIKNNLCNTLLLKINQIGTLTESIESYHLAKSAGWEVIVSHRSGETTDSFISDLAVALQSPIKLGAPARGERICKYNRLLEIYKNK